MAIISQLKYGPVTTLTVTGLNGLANQATAVSSTIDNTGVSAGFYDIGVQVVLPEIVEGGSRQVTIYAVTSLDGTTFSEINISNFGNMRPVGSVPMIGTGPHVSPMINIAPAFNNLLPPYIRLVFFNNAGNSLAASGNIVTYRTIYPSA